MKILIIGNSGSGKSWLGRELSSKHNIPVFEMDKVVWETGGFNKKRSKEDLANSIIEIKKKGCWIVEGVFGDVAEKFIDEATELIWLNHDWSKCLENLKKRGPNYDTYENSKDAEKAFDELVEWASKYWERDGYCCYNFHKELETSFKRKSK